MSCIITYKGQKYSEEQFKEYFINNKQEFITSIAKNKDIIDSFKRKNVFNQTLNTTNESFDKELAEKIQNKLQQLYPEIKLNITNNPIWEQGDNIFNQEEYNNQVNYRLKATEILLSDKAIQLFEKGKKANWDLNKILTELQIPKEQKQLILDLNITEKDVKNKYEFIRELEENDSIKIPSLREELALELANNYSYSVEINTAKEKSSMTKEIKSVNGFSINGDIYDRTTDEDIFGVGDKEIFTKNNKEISEQEYRDALFEYNHRVETPTQHYSSLTAPGGTNYTERAIKLKGIKLKQGSEGVYHENEFNNNEGDMLAWSRQDELATDTSIVRIKEIQSRLQKHRGEVKLTEGSELENNMLQLFAKDDNWVTFVIKSLVQQAAKEGKSKIWFPKGETAAKIEGHETIADEIRKIDNDIKQTEKDLENTKKNQAGKTVTDVVEDTVYGGKNTFSFKVDNARLTYDTLAEANEKREKFLVGNVVQLENKLKSLEKEKTNLKSQGIEKLKPIEAFYEIKVGNILEKLFGKNNVKVITDEYGNAWNEISINQARDLANVLLQRNEANQIIGQANIKAMTVLIDAINQKQDTLPHEYAHHYIAWFRNTPIVQEAIKKWGSEEALVQSIGEQVVKQKGEAYNWWNNFVKWIMNQFNSLSKLEKQELTQILTDAFLTRQDLNNSQNTNEFNFGLSDNEIINLINEC